MYAKSRFRLAGDKGFLTEFGAAIDPEINRKGRQICFSLAKTPIDGVSEIISTYRSIFTFYDPFQSDLDRPKKEILNRENRLEK